ncbi:MAG TPA: Gfo/Idh/MocA family oxidoreductase [Planctomycetes bacterium]|nr:Gfo/Idh/MocA family oxidoreductase [Planctomycetota bacterium]
MSKQRISRRRFLAATATTAAVTIVPGHVLGGPRNTPPSAKLNIAGIGIGGMGKSNLRQLESENIVALCDVDHNYAAQTFKRYPKAKVYTDFRKMLDKQKDIDAVVIATPDHTHAVISMEAMRRGKHVYCQKPLTHDVYESRMLAKTAKETGVTTQMGIQGHSGEGIRLISEWIWGGAIGEVREVDAWCSLSYYPFGHTWWSSRWSRRPKETPPVPSTLDWDLWLGPAPERPYHPAYHPGVWRCWWDFGCGMMGDRGAHTLDPVFWALKLGHPTSVEATSLDLNPDTHPVASIVTYRFPARGNLPPVKLTWYDGLRPPRPIELEHGRRLGNVEGGALFKGSKGKLMAGVYGEGPRLIPEGRMKEYKQPAKTIPRVKGSHERDWVRACKSGRPAGADFEYSGLLTEVCLLGNVARRVDANIEWDAENMKATNLPEADKYIRTPYRKGWTL